MGKPKNQLRDDNFSRKLYKQTGSLTEKDLREFISELDFGEPKFVVYQKCITQGAVKRTEFDLGICGNPKCISCNEIVKALNNYGK